jgi:hypothetical protein
MSIFPFFTVQVRSTINHKTDSDFKGRFQGKQRDREHENQKVRKPLMKMERKIPLHLPWLTPLSTHKQSITDPTIIFQMCYR